MVIISLLLKYNVYIEATRKMVIISLLLNYNVYILMKLNIVVYCDIFI